MSNTTSPRLVALDLDGTLLNHQGQVTPRTRQAIAEAVARGIVVLPATGRPLSNLPPVVAQLTGVRYAITSNGALIYDAHTKKIIFQTGVDKNCIREAFDEAYKFGLHPQTYSDHGVLCEREDPEIQYYAKSTMVNYEVLDDVTKVITRDPIKMLFIDLHNRANLEKFREHMESWSKKHHIDMFFSCDIYLEFLPEGINKGSGIRWLCNYLNVPLDNTLAAGDAENDITMLQAVKTPCVMKNARPDVRLRRLHYRARQQSFRNCGNYSEIHACLSCFTE